MLVAVINVNQIKKIMPIVDGAKNMCDAFELRLDYLDAIDVQQLADVRNKIKKPVIFTLRPASHGGLFSGTEAERLLLIAQLALLQPDYFDLEHDVDHDFLTDFNERYSAIKIIRSYHNFDNTPDNLQAILESMHHPSCSIYKMATYATSSLDALRILHLAKDNSPQIKIAAHCMGEFGVPSRVLGPIVGSCLQYASTDSTAPPAPGCLTLNEYVETYRYNKLNKDTSIFALLGDPVEQSVGHLFHNKKYSELDLNAVYVKFNVVPYSGATLSSVMIATCE